MTAYRTRLSWMLIVVLCITAMVPAAPAYAFSLSDLLPASNSGGGFLQILLGLLVGNLVNKFSPPAPEVRDGIKPPVVTAADGKEIIGFYAEWWGKDTSSFESLSRNVKAVRTIAPFWATLQQDGTVTDRGGEDHQAVVNFAHKNNISVLLLVNNAKESNGQIPVHAVLANQALRAKAISNLEAYIKEYKLDGINIDFEMVPASDRNNLTLFMKELSERLKPQGYLVTMDVFPKQDESNDVAYAYDYAALASYADKIMLMTYDQHGAWSGPGPIAESKWAERNLVYALKHIPKQKLYLGIAAYGYDWSVNGVQSLEYRQVMELVRKYQAVIQWDEPSKTPFFSYTDEQGVKHEVWFESSESLKPKLDLVNRYGIAGIAMWKLGEEDPAYWQVFREKLAPKQ